MLRLFLYVLAGVLGYFTVAAPIADAWYNPVQAAPPYEASDRDRAVHAPLMVANLHNDPLLWHRDPLERYDRGHTDVPRAGGGAPGPAPQPLPEILDTFRRTAAPEDGLLCVGTHKVMEVLPAEFRDSQ